MKFKNYHLRERHPEGFISTQPHKPRLEATETDSKSGIWIGSAGDNKFFKKEDYRFLYELFRELVENGIEPLTDDLMHKDELAKLRAERDALVERANEQYLEQVKETAALRVGIGLLTTLAPDVDCGLPITELCSAVHNAVTAEIAALREGAIEKAQEIQDLRVQIGELDLVLQSAARNADRVINEQAAEIAALREVVRMAGDPMDDAPISSGEQERKILQLLSMNHSLKREIEELARIAALREERDRLAALVDRLEKWEASPEVQRAMEEER